MKSAFTNQPRHLISLVKTHPTDDWTQSSGGWKTISRSQMSMTNNHQSRYNLPTFTPLLAHYPTIILLTHHINPLSRSKPTIQPTTMTSSKARLPQGPPGGSLLLARVTWSLGKQKINVEFYWLVVSTHLKNISQMGWIYGKIKNIPSGYLT